MKLAFRANAFGSSKRRTHGITITAPVLAMVTRHTTLRFCPSATRSKTGISEVKNNLKRKILASITGQLDTCPKLYFGLVRPNNAFVWANGDPSDYTNWVPGKNFF